MVSVNQGWQLGAPAFPGRASVRGGGPFWNLIAGAARGYELVGPVDGRVGRVSVIGPESSLPISSFLKDGIKGTPRINNTPAHWRQVVDTLQ